MKIIDAHAHLGECNVFDLNVDFDFLLRTMDDNEVRGALVQPFPGCQSPEKIHDRIAELSKEHQDRFYGVASINPHFGDRCQKELERCIRELGFVAVKMHTIGHAVLPTSKDAIRLCEIADDLKVPVMVHTGTGIPFALPSMILPLARQFPNVKFILCHAGYAFYVAEAMIVANEASNVFLEPSWCTSVQLMGMVKQLGSDRVMMGSDLPANLATEIAKARSISLTEEELSDYFQGTVSEVFGLQKP